MSDFLYIDQKTRTNVEKTSQANISKDLFENYRIDRSLRFNSADSAYLSRTLASTSARRIMTVSAWVKISSLQAGAIRGILSGGTGNFWDAFCLSNVSDEVRIFFDGGNGAYLTSSSLFRDFSAWYHFVFSVDTTQATESDRVRFFVNGVQQTLTGTQPTQHYQITKIFNSSFTQYIGATDGGAGGLNGYLTEFYAIDGQALTPSSFGFFDNQRDFTWKPKKYSGSYGNNGFYLNFSNNSSASLLGKDFSGNGNNWTPNNFAVSPLSDAGNDSLVDSPTNYGTDTGVGGTVRGNYATLNPLDNGGLTLANGNLNASRATASWASARSTVGMSSGKWYWEVTPTSGLSVGSTTNQTMIGISKSSAPLDSAVGTFYGSADGWGYYFNSGQKWNNDSGTNYGATYTNNDVIGIAFDADNGTLTFYKNGISQGTAFSGLTNGPYFPTHGLFGTASSVVNFGQRPFAYTAPAGFKALCTTNLPIPSIKKPSSYFDAVTYTGNGATSQDITSLSFSPDLVWLKSRTDAYDHRLKDSTRGNSVLFSNLTNAESAYSLNFLSNGIRPILGYNDNISSKQYVAWSWKESPIAGMDIVSYVGDGNSGRAISHGLGVAPKFILVKNRTIVSDWPVYHASLPASNLVFLHLTNATAAISAMAWGAVSSTSSSTFTVIAGNTDIRNVNKVSDNYIAYCFAEVEGFSKFGAFAGNNSTNGPFIWCGFRPKYILVKKTSASGPWMVFDSSRDTFNVSTTELRPNETSAEPITARGSMDILSNGFKIRSTSATYLGELGDFVFAAFAETPFKNARAR